MEQLKTDFQKLFNDNPIDSANKVQSQEHIEHIVSEDIHDAKTGAIHTDKSNLTFRIKDASATAIKDRMGRWVALRNDLLVRAKEKHGAASASGLDTKAQELNQKTEDERNKVREAFIRDNDYSDKKHQYDQTKNLFEKMQAEMGGKPPVPKRFFLYIISILMVGFVEWFINYSTFLVKYPPGVAAGATILIALSIALASHFHGGLLKQRLALFARHRTAAQKRHVIIYQLFFSFLLVGALTGVTLARYDVLAGQLVASAGPALPSLPGAEAQAASTVTDELIPFVIMNLLVWIVGVAISFFIHDARPDYQEAQVEYQKAKKKFYAVDKKLQEEMDRIDHQYADEVSRLKNSHSSHTDNAKELESYLLRTAAKEESLLNQALSEINDAVHRHQSMLVTALKQYNLTDVTIGPDQLTPDQYLKLDLKMNERELRQILTLEPIR